MTGAENQNHTAVSTVWIATMVYTMDQQIWLSWCICSGEMVRYVLFRPASQVSILCTKIVFTQRRQHRYIAERLEFKANFDSSQCKGQSNGTKISGNTRKFPVYPFTWLLDSPCKPADLFFFRFQIMFYFFFYSLPPPSPYLESECRLTTGCALCNCNALYSVI